MRTLLVLFTSIISMSAWAGALDDARTLGAPMESVERAIQLSRGKEFSRKDILAIFDISQPSGNRRFFLIDLKTTERALIMPLMENQMVTICERQSFVVSAATMTWFRSVL